MQKIHNLPTQNKTEDVVLYAWGLQTKNAVTVKSGLAGNPSKLGWQSISNQGQDLIMVNL